MDKKNVYSILQSKIVVPEIQREYVWGANKDNPDIVKNFVSDINAEAGNDKEFPLGFLYSYEHGGELHLIDGQQRMTTIVLLAFYCFCKEGATNPTVLELLKNFSYRVRTDTEDFLFSLYAHNKEFAADLKLFKRESLCNERWYRSKYDSDTTISSMVKCLDTIRSIDNDSFILTTEKILSNLTFWTFEVTQTSQGEELYISMNSRGEALTDAELLKPRLFERAKSQTSKYRISWGKAWDNWEELLFSHKGNFSADAVGLAMNEFLRCVIEIVSGKPHQSINPSKDIEIVDLSIIEDYFDALNVVFQSDLFRTEAKYLFDSGKSHLVLKVLLAILHQGEPLAEVERIYPILKNWERREQLNNEGVLKTIFDYQHQQVKLGWLDYILSVINPNLSARERKIDGVLDDHEWIKVFRYQEYKNSDLELAYHQAEEDDILHGYIRAVWYEAFESDFAWTNESLGIFTRRYQAFKILFDEKYISINLSTEPDSQRIDNSLIARAMLAIAPYRMHVSGQNYAYGWKGKTNYWRLLAKEQEPARIISSIIDNILDDNDLSEAGIVRVLNGIIGKALYDNRYSLNNSLYYILKYPFSLKAQYEGHNVLSIDGSWDNFNIWILEKDNAHSYYFQMFLSILLHINEGKEGIQQLYTGELVFKNGLKLKCSYLQGWDVVYKEWKGDKTKLMNDLIIFAEKKGTSVIDNTTTQKLGQYYVPRGENEQIELGCDILEFVRTYE